MRETAETRVRVDIDLDGGGESTIDTAIPFFDHMLEAASFHGGFRLEVEAGGDHERGGHHVVEDAGIVIGRALREAWMAGGPVVRFGRAVIPMDDALVRAVLDAANRAYLACRLQLPPRRWGAFHSDLIPEFFRAFTRESGVTLHLDQLAGKDPHHVSEAAFKAVGAALGQALVLRRTKAPRSTKGAL